LKKEGCSVVSASDSDEALNLFHKSDFDLVLMDLRMPRVSGCETTKAIRDSEQCDGSHVPIVGLTASPLLEEQERAIAAGMDEVIVKPVDELKLRSVLSRYT
jgi:CheY-like chemotaxis protein